MFFTLFSRCNVFIGTRNLKKNKDVENHEEEEEGLLPCIPQNQQDIIESCVEGMKLTLFVNVWGEKTYIDMMNNNA